MKKLLGLFLAAVVVASNSLYATEIDMLVNKLAEKGVISYGEAQQIITETNEEVRKNIAAGQVSTIPAWVQNIAMSGDLRLRVQDDWQAAKTYPEQRERIRLRFGFETRVIENIKAGFGLASGTETMAALGGAVYDSVPASANATLSNGFGRIPIMIDFAFIQYNPMNALSVTAGKMKGATALFNVSDFLWDYNINPDGFSAKYQTDINSSLNLFCIGSWLTLNNNGFATTGANPDPDAYIVQPGAVWKANENIIVKGTIGYQQFNVAGKTLVFLSGPAGAAPTFDYNCWTPNAQIDYNNLICGYTLTVFGDYVNNTNSGVNTSATVGLGNSGYDYGVKFGSPSISKFKDWNVMYMARYLEGNAWLTCLGDQDAYSGANNVQGFKGSGSFGLTKSTWLTLSWYYLDKIIGSTATTARSLAQFDVMTKF